jgi:hypothetical protein
MNHEKIKLKCIELAYEQSDNDDVVLTRAQKYFEFVTKEQVTNIAEEEIDLTLLDLGDIAKLLSKKYGTVSVEYATHDYPFDTAVVINSATQTLMSSFAWFQPKAFHRIKFNGQSFTIQEEIRKLLA